MTTLVDPGGVTNVLVETWCLANATASQLPTGKCVGWRILNEHNLLLVHGHTSIKYA